MSVYGAFATDLLNSYLSGKTVKALLVTSSYAQQVDTETYLADINALGLEVVTAGYTAGGVVVTNLVVTYDATVDSAVLACDPVNFGTFTSGVTGVGGPIFYIDMGDPATSRLILADMSSSPFDVPVGTDCIYNVDSSLGITAAQVVSP